MKQTWTREEAIAYGERVRDRMLVLGGVGLCSCSYAGCEHDEFGREVRGDGVSSGLNLACLLDVIEWVEDGEHAVVSRDGRFRITESTTGNFCPLPLRLTDGAHFVGNYMESRNAKAEAQRRADVLVQSVMKW